MTDKHEELSRPDVEPMPTEAELDELAAWTQEWVFDDILFNTTPSRGITAVRHVLKTRQWQQFANDTVRTHGEVGKELILEVLHDVCTEHVRQQRVISSRERRAKQAEDRAKKRREEQQPQISWETIQKMVWGQR
jgi:hypothetical protein